MKTVFFWVVALGVVLLGFYMISNAQARNLEIEFSKFMDRVERGEVAEVKIVGRRVEGKLKTHDEKGKPREFFTYLPPEYPDLVESLRAQGVVISVKEDSGGSILTLFLHWAPLLVIIAIWIFFIRQMQAGGNRALSFGKSRAKLSSNQKKKVTFKDVAGVEEAKEELQEIIEFLKDPQKFQKLGGRIPKGVLLVGPPGTGKTLLARAISGEANVPFFSISGSDFVEMFVGVGASRVRDLFEQGKKNAPCIIFIDEIDAVGRHRGAGLGGGHDEREQTLNQLLVEMDGFESNDGVILVSATNRPDVLDPALLRPGRFDRRIVVPRPDVRGREEILKVHTRKIPVDGNVDLSVIARGTPGFSGADLANLVNEAALNAARYGKANVEMEDFEGAKDKVLMGTERKSLMISEEEKRITAYHEAGHALVAALLPETDPIHKVTIIPRGAALGLTQQLPLDDRYTYSREFLLDRISVMMGGRVAEELTFRKITTGAGNDFQQATETARKMVCEWGMSDKLGPQTFVDQDREVFLGRDFAVHKEYSEATANLIDAEVNGIVTECYGRARDILEHHRVELERVAEALLERETLEGHEVLALIEGKPLPTSEPAEPEGPEPDATPSVSEDRERKQKTGIKEKLTPQEVPT